ncbi:DUF4244 domain-containing protein [Streptomyces sp. NBC_01471]|uniref:DUF4244 domain-containing protein n=1 Tax=Streptomyces sp. NBC_01471 TaxID=2903879 RepID=UPI003252A3D5
MVNVRKLPNGSAAPQKSGEPGGSGAWTWMRARWHLLGFGAGRDAGMSTSEYAMGTIAACAFAAVLYKVVTSGPVAAALQSVVEKALHAKF